jgi:hypothetical protein
VSADAGKASVQQDAHACSTPCSSWRALRRRASERKQRGGERRRRSGAAHVGDVVRREVQRCAKRSAEGVLTRVVQEGRWRERQRDTLVPLRWRLICGARCT